MQNSVQDGICQGGVFCKVVVPQLSGKLADDDGRGSFVTATLQFKQDTALVRVRLLEAPFVQNQNWKFRKAFQSGEVSTVAFLNGKFM